MIKIDYTGFGTRQLDQLFEHSKRSEQDLQHRLEARLRHAELPSTRHTFNLDPVAKRLGFLLAKIRGQRRAVGRELAMRSHRGDEVSHSVEKLEGERSGAEGPQLIYDKPSMQTHTYW